MATVSIEVTQQDIDDGTRGDPQLCPIAWAARRATLDVRVILSNDKGIVKGQLVRFPKPVSRFIADFDSGRPVAPFAFDLDIPDGLLP